MEHIDTEECHFKELDHLFRAQMRDKGNADPAISVDMNHYVNLSLGKHYQVIRIGIYRIQYMAFPGVVNVKDDPIYLARSQNSELSKIDFKVIRKIASID